MKNLPRLGALLLLLPGLALLASCSGDSDDLPTGPVTQGQGSARFLIQELDAIGGAVLSERTVEVTRIVAGISRATKEGPSRLKVAQDMTVTFQFPGGGSLLIEIINYKERFERGLAIDDFAPVDLSADPDFRNAGELSVVRFQYFETQADSTNRTPFESAPPAVDSPFTWLVVEDVTVEALIARFDAQLNDSESPRVVRLATVDASGSPASFRAPLSEAGGQAFDPIPIVEQVGMTGGGGADCVFTVETALSVDPNGELVRYGVDADGDFAVDTPPGWIAFNDGDPPSNTQVDVTVPAGSSNFIVRTVMEDEEGRQALSSNLVLNCP